MQQVLPTFLKSSTISGMSERFDLQQMLSDGTHFSKRSNGVTYIINSLTGKTVAALEHLETPGSHEVTLQMVNGEEIWSDRANPTVIVGGGIQFNPVLVDELCAKIVDGAALTEACGKDGMPTYVQLCRWRRQMPWIDEALTQARRDRAERYRDEALAIAASSDEDNVKSSNLQVETLKWAAGVDHEKYSPKAKLEATIQAPTQIIVQTGIDRGMNEENTRIVTAGNQVPAPARPEASNKHNGVLELAAETVGGGEKAP